MKPPAFNRPSINLAPAGRTWGESSPKKLSIGDHIPDQGIVDQIRILHDHKAIAVSLSSGEVAIYSLDETIKFFGTHA